MKLIFKLTMACANNYKLLNFINFKNKLYLIKFNEKNTEIVDIDEDKIVLRKSFEVSNKKIIIVDTNLIYIYETICYNYTEEIKNRYLHEINLHMNLWKKHEMSDGPNLFYNHCYDRKFLFQLSEDFKYSLFRLNLSEKKWTKWHFSFKPELSRGTLTGNIKNFAFKTMVVTDKIRIYGHTRNYILHPKYGEFELFNLNKKNFTIDDFSKCLAFNIIDDKLCIYSNDDYLKIINLSNNNIIKIPMKTNLSKISACIIYKNKIHIVNNDFPNKIYKFDIIIPKEDLKKLYEWK